jgi:hypothetical protein
MKIHNIYILRATKYVLYHSASYPVGTRGSFTGGKTAWRVKLTTHLQLVPKPKNAWSYISIPPIRFHGVVLSYKKKKARGRFYITFTNAVEITEALVFSFPVTKYQQDL